MKQKNLHVVVMFFLLMFVSCQKDMVNEDKTTTIVWRLLRLRAPDILIQKK
jgi:hypothetical protein